MATEGQIADYSQAQKFITSQARQDLTVLWREAQQLPLEQARRFLKEGVQALVDRYGLMAASVAADFFEALTGETAIVPESYSPAQIQASTNWALQDTSQEETAGALRGDGLERLASVTVRLVLQYGRNTIDTSVASTPGVLYARKIMGETCDFCLLLASRGPVYGDAQKAGGDGNSYHNDCDCVPVPCKGEWQGGHWVGDDPGYDYQRLYAEEYAPYHRRGDSIQQTLARKRRILKANQPTGRRGRPRKVEMVQAESGRTIPVLSRHEVVTPRGERAVVYRVDVSYAQQMHDDLQAVYDASAFGKQVTVPTTEELRNEFTHLYVTDDGLAGCGIRKSGEISAVYNSAGQHHASEKLLTQAVKDGGTFLECFETYLPHVYEGAGFEPVAAVPFDREFAPDGWNYATLREYNNGEPDILFMVPKGSGKELRRFESYDDAERYTRT